MKQLIDTTLQKGALWIMIRLESLILRHVNAKLFREVNYARAYLSEMNAFAMHKHMGQSARRETCAARSKVLPPSAQILIK